MAQVDFTLSQEEVLEVLSTDRDSAFKFIVEKILNQVMLAESEMQLGAMMHERTEKRTDYRNGFRTRMYTTRVGTIELRVPRHRNLPFCTMVFENYCRSEASLLATMVQMVIDGVSTRKVANVVDLLCGESFSKSTVSELCKRLDEEINEFRNRSLTDYECPFLMLDATYFKTRENHRVVSKSFMIATAVKGDGSREIIGFDVYDNESNDTWRDFVRRLKARGLKDVGMVISDGHKSIRHTIIHELHGAAWQRCQFHFTKNIVDAIPKKYKKGIATELREMFNSETIQEARARKDEIIKDYEDIAPRAMETLDLGFDDSMTVLLLPKHMRRVLRTTNPIERVNGELKRRSDVIRIFPNPDSILRLMGSVAMEYNDVLVTRRHAFGRPTYEQYKKVCRPKLIKLAETQPSLLEAA